jgi:regulatory protein
MDESIEDDIKPSKKRERKPPKKITEQYLHNSGLYYLQRFPASAAHFKRVMMRKVDKSCRHHANQDRKSCEDLVDTLVLKFQEMGLLNDTGYSRGMVNSYRARGLSTRSIQAKLSQKGLTPQQISEALNEFDNDRPRTEIDMVAALKLARKKRIGPYTSEKDIPRDKQIAMMARAGFGFDICSRALSMSKDEAEEFIYSLPL